MQSRPTLGRSGSEPGTAQQGAGTYSTGSEHGDPMHGGDDTDPVETAFKT